MGCQTCRAGTPTNGSPNTYAATQLGALAWQPPTSSA
nr:MAG TPA: hypothetical protein [Caudoviricetes sp.]